MCLVLMLIAAFAAVYLLSPDGGWLLWIVASVFVLTCPVLAYLVYRKYGREPGAAETGARIGRH
jgi:hypothetical protein